MFRKFNSRWFIVIAILGFFNIVGYSQREDTAIINIKYKLTYLADTTQRDSPSVSYYILGVGATYSEYRSFYNFEAMRDLEQFFPPPPPDVVNVPMNNIAFIEVLQSSGIMSTDMIYRSLKQNKLTILGNRSFKIYYTQYQLPIMAWKLENGEKPIANLSCRKATGKYKGRSYTAWYAPDLPFSYGPWKFGDLPGVIMEIVDSRNEVKFEAIDIFNYGSYTDIDLSMGPIVSNEEFYNQERLHALDLKKYYLANVLNTGDHKHKIYYYNNEKLIDVDKLNPELRNKFLHPYLLVNNPIELEK